MKVELIEQTMNQSRKSYTLAVAGFTTEADMMSYFCELVDAFLVVERNEYCTVDGVDYPVHISCQSCCGYGISV